jgi:hypothetical protein
MKAKEEMIEVIAKVIVDMADRNMCLDGNGQPILYNDEGIANAALEALCKVLPELKQPHYGTKHIAEAYNQLRSYASKP